MRAARPNEESCEDYTDVFLAHAQLYVFADRYDVEGLQRLSLSKLHDTLVKFNLYSERVADVVTLLKYTYQHTSNRTEQIDELRSLVIGYVCCRSDKLLSIEAFRNELNVQNPASLDLIDQMLKDFR